MYAIALYHVISLWTNFSWVKGFVRGAKRLCLTIKDNHLVWDLQFIFESLQQAPFTPLSSRSLAWLTWKTAVLVTVTTARGVGELKASFFCIGQVLADYSQRCPNAVESCVYSES